MPIQILKPPRPFSREMLGAFLFLLGLHVLFFYRVFGGGLFFGSDTVYASYPALVFAHDFRSLTGHVPYWNPYSDCGNPFFTSFPWISLYPPVRLLLGFSPVIIFAVVPLLHSLFGALFAYLAFRSFVTNPFPALIGAVLFAFGGVVPLRLFAGHVNALFALTWGALLFFLWAQFVRTNQLRYILWGGAALCFQILAGYHQYVFLTHIVLIPYVVFLLVGNGWTIRKTASMAGLLVLYLGIGITLSAIQWFPMLLAHQESVRGVGLPWDYLLQFSTEPRHALALLVPQLFGNGVSEPFFPLGSFVWEAPGYLGLTALPFALAGFRGRKWEIPALALSLVCFVLSMGEAFPLVYKFFASVVPGLKMFRAPVRMLLPVFFIFVIFVVAGAKNLLKAEENREPISFSRLLLSLLILSGAGLFVVPAIREFWVGDPQAAFLSPLPIVISVGAAALLCLLLRYARGLTFRRMGIASLALVVFDLWVAHGPYYQTVSLSYFSPPPFSFGPWRVYANDKDVRFSSQAALHRIYHFGGIAPFLTSRFNDFLNVTQGTSLETNRAVFNKPMFSPLLSLGSVRWVLADRNDASTRGLVHRMDFGPYQIFENSKAFPRAYFVSRVVSNLDRIETLSFIRNSYARLRNLAIVDAPWKEVPLTKPSAEPQETDRSPDEVQFRLPELLQDAFLVLTDSYANGWKAFVDGRSVSIFPTNWWMQGILIPPGSRTLLLRYHPPGLRLGTILTVVGGIIWLIILLIAPWQNRRKDQFSRLDEEA